MGTAWWQKPAKPGIGKARSGACAARGAAWRQGRARKGTRRKGRGRKVSTKAVSAKALRGVAECCVLQKMKTKLFV